MAKNTVEEAYQIYQIEGHGYAVENYIRDIETEDPELNELWRNATYALTELTKFFNKKVESGEIDFFEY